MNEEKLTIIFTEDEKIIRDSLIKGINWKSLGVNLLLEVSDAEELLALMQIQKPDIIFMDICMPGMDGIEASRIVREIYPDVHIVILTSYNDFDYVRDGLRIGVDEYLLKPVDYDEVVRTVQEIRVKIAERTRQEKRYEEMESMLNKNMPVIASKKFMEIVREKKTAKEIMRETESNGLSMRSNYIQAALVLARYVEDGKNGSIDMLGKAEEMLKEYFFNMNWVNIFQDNKGYIVILNNNNMMSLEQECRKLANLTDKKGEWKIYIGLSNEYWNITKIPDAYFESQKALKYRASVKWNQCISYADICQNEDEVTEINTDLFDDIEMAVKVGDTRKVKEQMTNLWMQGGEWKIVSMAVLHSMAAIIVTRIMRLAREYGILPEISAREKEVYGYIYRIENIPDMVDCLNEYIEQVLSIIQENSKKNSSGFLKDIADFIDDNIQDPNLSLTGVAEYFFVNASYLSRMLKEYLGVNFSDYCVKKRLDIAMKMFLQTDKKAYEIAEEVGFKDPKYFNACFKKHTGVSVNDFKKNMRNIAEKKEKREDK